VCEGSIVECSNSGFDLIDIFASDEAIIKVDSQQLLEEGNECTNASCSNIFGLNNFALTAPDQGSVDVKAAQDTETKMNAEM
jgi:hypothetical protein